uniref:Uncharacterized protein n=1 Tax=Brassica oleracea TaxID=3712 RepID=A0A3P6DMU4_BRAOL|nr:unnamed protein product [Brassica oleracea]
MIGMSFCISAGSSIGAPRRKVARILVVVGGETSRFSLPCIFPVTSVGLAGGAPRQRDTRVLAGGLEYMS